MTHSSDSERLARIETKLDEVLTPLQASVASNTVRVVSLETFRSYVKGVAAAVVSILGILGIERFLTK